VSYDSLRKECERERIGPLLWSLLLDVARRVSRKYPPDLYNDGEVWTDESCTDLALEVALVRLLEENQLEYVLTVADESPGDRYEALAKLLSFQVRRVLGHRRRKTVVDRLHTRVKALVTDPPFEIGQVGGETAIALENEPGLARQLTDAEIRRGADLIASIPRLPSRVGAARESKVYTGAHLQELVTTLVTSLGPVLLGDIRRILELTLTAWVPTLLRDDEEESALYAAPEFELERGQMQALITTVVAALDPVHRAVLIGKSQGIADGQLAERVGRSRPWLADRKAEALARVQIELIEPLPDALHDEAIRQLLEACAALEESEG
jgi:hypothetical protein